MYVLELLDTSSLLFCNASGFNQLCQM